MRQIKEVLRLRYALNLSQQAIGHATGISRSTVKDYLARATLANIIPSYFLHLTIRSYSVNSLIGHACTKAYLSRV